VGPGGTYDGTYIQDYEYVSGLGNLDAQNGATVTTVDFPDGTYGYFLTLTFPNIPRAWVGTPHESFMIRGDGSAPVNMGSTGTGPGGTGPSTPSSI
ncbi:MAG: YHYH protein, partial [Pseudomonadota bacterium]